MRLIKHIGCTNARYTKGRTCRSVIAENDHLYYPNPLENKGNLCPEGCHEDIVKKIINKEMFY